LVVGVAGLLVAGFTVVPVFAVVVGPAVAGLLEGTEVGFVAGVSENLGSLGQWRRIPPGQKIPPTIASMITTADPTMIDPRWPSRFGVRRPRRAQRRTTASTAAVTTTRRVIRGWRLSKPPPPGTPGFPGRMSQIINAVPTTIPTLTATAVMTSARGRDGTNCCRVREGLMAASPFHHPPDHDRDLVEEVHGDSHEE
jgi:hypothetical protein